MLFFLQWSLQLDFVSIEENAHNSNYFRNAETVIWTTTLVNLSAYNNSTDNLLPQHILSFKRNKKYRSATKQNQSCPISNLNGDFVQTSNFDCWIGVTHYVVILNVIQRFFCPQMWFSLNYHFQVKRWVHYGLDFKKVAFLKATETVNVSEYCKNIRFTQYNVKSTYDGRNNVLYVVMYILIFSHFPNDALRLIQSSFSGIHVLYFILARIFLSYEGYSLITANWESV